MGCLLETLVDEIRARMAWKGRVEEGLAAECEVFFGAATANEMAIATVTAGGASL